MGSLAARVPYALTAVLVALAAGNALAGCGEEEAPVVPTPQGATPPPTLTDALEAEESTTAEARPRGRLTVHVTRTVRLRSSPGGPVVGWVDPRTEWDSPTVLPVVRRQGAWLGVITPKVPNGRIGWISANTELEPHRTRWSVVVSLRRREVVVRRAGRVAQRFPVAIGTPSSPTPSGRFAVTDKLLTEDAGSPYGCCILALSARQPHTPQGWGGGDRVAIHATNSPETIGTAASLGCMRAPTDAIRRAVRSVPLGTIVTIRA
jgi:lipoprotein-anchoring transpeptidase ErfK/SrfK